MPGWALPGPAWADAVLGLRRFLELNARIEQEEIVVPGRVNLGFAARAGHGLVVPIVPDAHRLSTRDLPGRLAERTAAANMTDNDPVASCKAIVEADAVPTYRVTMCA